MKIYKRPKTEEELETFSLKESTLDYNGRQLLVLQGKFEGIEQRYIAVPGFVIGNSKDNVEIEPIPEELKQDIEKFLRAEGLEGKVGFW